MAGLDPRAIQSQRQNFNTVAQILLAKKRHEDQIRAETEKAELAGITTLLKNPNIPTGMKADLANKALMKLRLPTTTEGAISQQERIVRERDILEDIISGSLGKNVQNVQQAIDLMREEGRLGPFQTTLDPLEKQKIESEEQRTEAFRQLAGERETGQLVDLARIKKLKAQTSEAMKKAARASTGTTKDQVGALNTFINSAVKEMDALTFTDPTDRQEKFRDANRVKQLRAGIESASRKMAKLNNVEAPTKKEIDSMIVIERVKRMVKSGELSKKRARFVINGLITEGVKKSFILNQLGK